MLQYQRTSKFWQRVRSMKFKEMRKTANGQERASVTLKELKTLWFNTGTLCNLKCENCYIKSSPTNDRLSFLTMLEVKGVLADVSSVETKVIGLTGGEPFLNPEIIDILHLCLSSGYEVLVLTNANRVIKRHEESLLKLLSQFGHKLQIRVSLDHYSKEIHEKERGPLTFDRTLNQVKWLYDRGFNISIASRSLGDETEEQALKGHEELLNQHRISIDTTRSLVIFPEMESGKDVPEITIHCWDILNKKPEHQMCATERMIVKRKGDESISVMPCTLLAYDDKFVLGKNIKEAEKKVYLNHKFCAEFCVLGGASCSSTA
mgnify:FL=1